MKNVTSIGNSVCVVGMEVNLRIGRQIARMTVVVCASIMVFLAMALVPSIASADCPDAIIGCYKDYVPSLDFPGSPLMGKFTTGACWHWYTVMCTPCDSAAVLNKRCNDKFPDCENRCSAQVILW